MIPSGLHLKHTLKHTYCILSSAQIKHARVEIKSWCLQNTQGKKKQPKKGRFRHLWVCLIQPLSSSAQRYFPSCGEYWHYSLLGAIKHKHTHTQVHSSESVQLTADRLVAWLHSFGNFTSFTNTHFGHFERFPPGLFAHDQSVPLLKANTQQGIISSFSLLRLDLKQAKYFLFLKSLMWKKNVRKRKTHWRQNAFCMYLILVRSKMRTCMSSSMMPRCSETCSLRNSTSCSSWAWLRSVKELGRFSWDEVEGCCEGGRGEAAFSFCEQKQQRNGKVGMCSCELRRASYHSTFV